MELLHKACLEMRKENSLIMKFLAYLEAESS
jgi:hypothetical protein